MTDDNPTPLATTNQFNLSAYQDLARDLQPGELEAVLTDATRACEDVCVRRLAPFAKLETQRIDAGDLEESGDMSFPLPMQAQMGMDYSRALGIGAMGRHLWLSEYPPTYPDLWAQPENPAVGLITSIQVYWPYQSSPYLLGAGQWQHDVDTGHVRFLLGTFVPLGSVAYVSYTGGYATVPGSLKRAAITMAASMIIKELDPANGSQHDPDLLRDEAIELLDPYMRD